MYLTFCTNMDNPLTSVHSLILEYIMQFLIISGLSYQLPIVMWIFTISGIVEYKFWRQKLMYAVIIIAIFGAIISPDSSGVAIWFAAGPMLLLYVIGMLVIEKKVKNIPRRY